MASPAANLPTFAMVSRSSGCSPGARWECPDTGIEPTRPQGLTRRLQAAAWQRGVRGNLGPCGRRIALHPGAPLAGGMAAGPPAS